MCDHSKTSSGFGQFGIRVQTNVDASNCTSEKYVECLLENVVRSRMFHTGTGLLSKKLIDASGSETQSEAVGIAILNPRLDNSQRDTSAHFTAVASISIKSSGNARLTTPSNVLDG